MPVNVIPNPTGRLFVVSVYVTLSPSGSFACIATTTDVNSSNDPNEPGDVIQFGGKFPIVSSIILILNVLSVDLTPSNALIVKNDVVSIVSASFGKPDITPVFVFTDKPFGKPPAVKINFNVFGPSKSDAINSYL